MRRSQRQRIVGLAFWLAACGGLAFLVDAEQDYLQQEFADPARPAVEADNAAGGAAQQPGYVLPPLASFGDVLKRPLFVENRRPIVPAPPAERPVETAEFSIAGIVVSNDDRHVLVRVADAPATKRIREGETISGWSVEEILPDRVRLRRGEGLEEMKPKEKGLANGRAPAVGQRAPGAIVRPSAGTQPAAPATGLQTYAAGAQPQSATAATNVPKATPGAANVQRTTSPRRRER